MANLNNPAGRLEHWLRQGYAGKSKDGSALSEWGKVFHVSVASSEGKFECMKRGAAVAALARDTRAAVEEDLPAAFKPELLLRGYNEIEVVVDRFIYLPTIRMQEFFDGLTDAGWHSLAIIDAILATQIPEPLIEDAEKSRLDALVRELIGEVRSQESLDDDVRELILKRLLDVLEALRRVHLTGTDGVERATDALVTAVWRKCGAQWIKEDPTGRKVAQFVVAVSLALGIGANVKVLLPGADNAPTQTIIEQTTHVEIDLVDVDNNVVVVPGQNSQPTSEGDGPEGG